MKCQNKVARTVAPDSTVWLTATAQVRHSSHTFAHITNSFTWNVFSLPQQQARKMYLSTRVTSKHISQILEIIKTLHICDWLTFSDVITPTRTKLNMTVFCQTSSTNWVHCLLQLNLIHLCILIIIIIIIIFIYCNWVVTRCQWLFYIYTKNETVYYWI